MKAKFVLSKQTMIAQYNQIAEVVDVVAYSSKTNYLVAELLEESTNCMFSIHSIASLENVKDTSRVWFFAQAWNEKELETIFGNGVSNFVVDNERDLELLLSYIEKNDIKINLLLRMRLQEHTIHTGKYFVYGMYSKQIIELISQLKENKNVHELGVHFHRKSQNISEWSLQYELEQILPEETLLALDWVNIGGGIPVPYKNFRASVHKLVFAEIKKLREWLKQYDVKIIAEPGRFIAAPAIKLVAQIKNIYDANIIINCSLYNTALDTFVVHHKLLIEGELPENQGTAFVVKGITPDSMDLFRYRVWLDKPKIGDELVFLNAGAYNYASNFCNLSELKTEVVE